MFGHLVRMPPGRLPREVFQARPAGKRPRGRPRTRWRDYISSLAWEHLGIPQSELVDVAWERKVWGSAGTATPATRPRISGRRWMDGWMCKTDKLIRLYLNIKEYFKLRSSFE